jgi:chemotaxis protein CheZ
MSAFSSKREDYAVWVEALRDALARDDAHAFSVALAGFNGVHDSEIRHAVRRVASGLRAALEQFREDSRLADLAGRQVPDARQRLVHVLHLTDAAAHRTLDLVEKSCPLADEAAREATRLGSAGRQAPEALDAQMQAFLERTARHMGQVRNHLSEVLMAQGYQDLTGQIIRGVIKLVDELEAALGSLMRLAGVSPAAARVAEAGLHGPAVPGIDQPGNVSGQQDVDALLSGLGM